jgi:hypothetical protein
MIISKYVKMRLTIFLYKGGMYILKTGPLHPQNQAINYS